METLDVTQIEPRFKHSTIFQCFDELDGGESFIIHNDHDPKPLYYQMVAERGQTFDWEYVLEGPQFWEVKISKLNMGEKPTTIGELVAADYRKAAVFSKFGLDFCCGGKKSLKEACDAKGIDEKVVVSALAEVENQVTNTQHDFNSWELDFLVDYIINVHHKYVKDNVTMLYEYSDKVANRHGSNHPEVIKIAQLYERVAADFKAHMEKEEMVLFPYIKELVSTKKENSKIASSAFGNIENPINMMMTEHETVGEYMDEIHLLSNNFTPPADACTSYQVLYSKLDEFEKDLHQHVHLENNILFPKAIKLEKELLS
ncbi:MAG: iron-sulfur cluster repair di-iron protein [Flavobacteriales bacterium CG_4_10_14_0_2_um_filter_32_8]|nr:MAG: iron-sulfur cluster repair di-iron protein [Flavobacteriales bacterium CG_4_10_14_0_2_um_filter_32_8]PJB16516.1 MAG: iron-sulfur cluster repair di-iron protein [Flavobacteriales bacterium CG_4_9_14_3_um_filter_32_8]